MVISFSGIDCCGKSTQINRLIRELYGKVKELGMSGAGEDIRGHRIREKSFPGKAM
jgi:thymidylate kinase